MRSEPRVMDAAFYAEAPGRRAAKSDGSSQRPCVFALPLPRFSAWLEPATAASGPLHIVDLIPADLALTGRRLAIDLHAALAAIDASESSILCVKDE